ncbi:MAG: type II toxin-antitoxin system VapC family toxin [Candidatus Binatia bacterium]
MALILVDSCIVTDLADPESDWFEWSASTLESLEPTGTFVINPIIYAECSIGYDSIEEIEGFIARLGFALRPIPREALFLAGKAYVAYRKKAGRKENVLPDFFIGAHAAVEQLSLITRDKRRFATYFPTVTLIMPNQ